MRIGSTQLGPAGIVDAGEQHRWPLSGVRWLRWIQVVEVDVAVVGEIHGPHYEAGGHVADDARPSKLVVHRGDDDPAVSCPQN